MEDIKILSKEIVQLARLSLTGSRKDLEFYIRRLIRKIQKWDTAAAAELAEIVNHLPKRSSVVRSNEIDSMPVDKDTRLNLLKVDPNPFIENEPILLDRITSELDDIVAERARLEELLLAGAEATKAVLFVGPPGVGKSLSAKVLARNLKLPLLTLDLSAVMSSFLGRTGSNIRNVFDFAKSSTCVLFLDELDSIAKKRDDSAEVGELKRLVTVLLQELDAWPADNLIIAATNHDELLDPAVWRRFDRIIRFPAPTESQVTEIIKSELSGWKQVGPDLLAVLALLLKDQSHSEIIREIKNLKKTTILKGGDFDSAAETYIALAMSKLTHEDRINVANILHRTGRASQRKISELTGVSRDTIRKKADLGSEA
ncbi:MAG: hypothetical protein A2428_00950 [Bdellovibrionales bacterium RIFOXYC1_FULL_54_43]|nr:MAG: hypothetical protein A2428_00950 [Bdellovibrionales bacterium RIFOXYC1_FULL_54_43]OFZ82853.1 MAG: hypothetical protein A2603_11675 [Bdellovibrionales bacterium RIFOXYD1_FULL_55_31]